MSGLTLLAYSDNRKSDATPAVFLHGFLGNRGDWGDITQILSTARRCISLDLPGHGGSIFSDERLYSIDNAARLAIDSLDAIGVDSFHLIGYSMGGRLALYIALHFPSRVSSLFLESASPGIYDDAKRRERQLLDGELACKLLETNPREFLDNWYSRPLFASMGRFPEKLEQLKLSRTNYFAGGAAASLRHMGTGSQPSLWEKVPQLAMPTLLLTGALDNTFHDIAASMKERNSRIIARSLPNCGHNCHWENPRLFAAVVDEFLETKKVSIV